MRWFLHTVKLGGGSAAEDAARPATRDWRAMAVLCALVGALLAAPAWAKKAPPALDCASCHSDPAMTSDSGGKKHSIGVDPDKFKASIHGVLGCADCHSDVKEFPHAPAPAKVDCSSCHSETQAAYLRGIHAKARGKGVSQAATCSGCHGDVHAVLPSSDPQSRTHRTNLAQTCGSCHGEKFVMEPQGISTQPFFSYQESVHGRAVAAGSGKAAACTDCHRAHDILPPGDPKSPIFKFNVPQTCGQCHSDISHVYQTSIHGEALARGNWQSAVCTDCHGIHSIKKHIDPSSSVAAQALARTTCAQCHEGVRLSQEFGVPAGRARTYLDSYHGMAAQLDSKVVANCASCHGVHNIYRSSDPRSTINTANLAKTCGQCHPGASQKFAQVKVHVGVPLSKDVGSIGALWVRRVYIPMIFVVIGGMVLHNLVLWRRKLLARRATGIRTVERMNVRERVQHWLILTSFIALAITGFALKYPDSPLAWMLGSSESLRRIGHRVAGVVMIVAGLYHLFYITASKQGRRLLLDFLPTLQDLRDLKENLFYHLGWSEQQPRFARFTYGEKAEYLALVWGTFLMAVTGLIMWFKVQAGGWFTGAAVDIATAIHFYEAILAVLAIVVWHFYQVMFDPDVYPLDWTFWDGRISEERARHHHPRAYQESEPESEPHEDYNGDNRESDKR